MSISVWILTFNRPEALNRLIEHFGLEGFTVNIFSNHPVVKIKRELLDKKYVNQVIVNTLNSEISNAYCTRSWNSIYQKGFMLSEELIVLQDDTDIGSNFKYWIEEQSKKFDFIAGPAGDQFHYIKKSVLQKVGWWDERFAGACYCGDADYWKRVYYEYDKDKISIEDTHNWGFKHNVCGLMNNVITTFESKTIDKDYENQHWFLEKLNKCNNVLKYNQDWFKQKWGIDLDIGRPVVENYNRLVSEINWYPSYTKEFNITTYET